MLAVTESLVESKETAGRYRLPKGNPLPRFGSRKNPFARPPAATEPKLAAEPAPRPAHPVPPVTAPAASPEASAPAAPPVVPAASRRRPFAGIGLFRKTVSLLRSWSQRWRRIPRLRLGRPGKPAGLQRPVAGPVQGELSLDRVRVVRNDLRDSDVEVVPLRAVTGRPERGGAGVAATGAAAAGAWERWAGRLWGATPNQLR